MKIVITGGAGFIGRRLAEHLLRRGALAAADGRQQEIAEVVLFDHVPPSATLPGDPRLRFVNGDVADQAAVGRLIDRGTASVFHLAAVVSAEAEAATDKGYRVNLDGTRAVLEACRALGTVPRLVFASSIAAYGGALPPVVSDETPALPQTSYGAQKVMGELLVSDYSRKGFIDGRSARLPTIVVRPGRPNLAASSWVSSIIREPLSGLPFACPVSPASAMALLSPRRLIAALVRIHDLPTAELAPDRCLLLPAISATAAEMVEAVRRAGGAAAAARISFAPDPAIQRIVDSWPRAIAAARAKRLGITADRDIDAIVAAFIEDDLAAQQALISG